MPYDDPLHNLIDSSCSATSTPLLLPNASEPNFRYLDILVAFQAFMRWISIGIIGLACVYGIFSFFSLFTNVSFVLKLFVGYDLHTLPTLSSLPIATVSFPPLNLASIIGVIVSHFFSLSYTSIQTFDEAVSFSSNDFLKQPCANDNWFARYYPYSLSVCSIQMCDNTVLLSGSDFTKEPCTNVMWLTRYCLPLCSRPICALQRSRPSGMSLSPSHLLFTNCHHDGVILPSPVLYPPPPLAWTQSPM